MPETTTVVFAGGYTAGHLTPGFALAQAFEGDLGQEVRSLFIGSRSGPEGDLVVRAGWPFWPIDSHPVARGSLLSKLFGALSQLRAVGQAIRVLRRERASLVVSLGGHASLGPALAARILRLPVVLVEPNRHMGAAARLESKWADVVLTSPLVDGSQIKAPGKIVEWLPVRSELSSISSIGPDYPSRDSILVMTGSLGLPKLNAIAPRALVSLLAPGMKILHQAGLDCDPAPVRDAYSALGVDATVLQYFHDLPSAYRRARAIVTPAGAVTLHELPFVGVPAVIIPLESAAADHQTENARSFSKVTGSPVLAENELTADSLESVLRPLLNDGDERKASCRRMALARGTEQSTGAIQTIAALLKQDRPTI